MGVSGGGGGSSLIYIALLRFFNLTFLVRAVLEMLCL